MTKAVAPQENKLKLPTSWKSRVLPRRGTPFTRPIAPADPRTLAEAARREAEQADDLRAALALVANEDWAAAGRAHLDGAADPRGAAAVAALLIEPKERYGKSWMRPAFDAWAAEHGLAFAAAAAVEFLAVQERTETYLDRPPVADRVLVESPAAELDVLERELDHDGIAAARSLLARAGDDEYAAAVAAVAGRRTTPAARIAAMVLFPDEREWVLEGCADFMKARENCFNDDVVWYSMSSAEQVAAAGLLDADDHFIGYNALVTLVAHLGTDAFGVLTGMSRTSTFSSRFREHVLEAVSLIPSDEATAYLLSRLEGSAAFGFAARAAADFPLRTLRVAARLAPTMAAEERAGLVAVAALPDPALRVHLDATERAALDDLFATTGFVPEAAPDDLPPLLVAPPWTRRLPKAVAVTGLRSPAETHLVWAAGEQDAWNAIPDPDRHNEFWLEHFGTLPDLDAYGWRLTTFLANGDLALAEPRLEEWDGTGAPDHPSDLQRLLARFGEHVLDHVLRLSREHEVCYELPGPVLNLEAARLTAERLVRVKAARPHALRWLDRHGLAAVPYLVPDALGDDKDRRRYAEASLNHLTVRHGKAAVTAAAEPFGAEAAQAVGARLSDDPLTPSVKVVKPGKWAVPAALPQVLLKGRERALPAASVPHLITVLALTGPDYHYPGLDVVAEVCDPESLTRFSLALFERWLAAGAPAKDGWALRQLACFADAATVARLAERVRQWPDDNQHKRAATGLEVLAEIGTEDAMRALQQIAERTKFRALKTEAAGHITALAQRLGLSREQLADRLVPDLGLGDADALVLDYGPRSFTVVLDERLAPSVTDQTGKALKALPKPGVKDDPERATAAYQRFTALKKELRTVAAEQVRRLEAAMVAARTWTKDEFERLLVGHPLNRHLARRLVWSFEDGGAHTGFRIAEDLTYSDAHDDAVEVPDGAVIRLDHPVLMGDQTADWIRLFADYEILQPFDQLGRPVMALTAEERATGRLARFEGAAIEALRVLGAASQGWERAKPEDAGVEPGISCTLANGLVVAVALRPGIWAGSAADSPEQTVECATIAEGGPRWWFDERKPAPLHDLDPVTASEVLAKLTHLIDRS
ncbi:DUF4132 domain-containing protein [Glycomyces terrestris]|uniref:DUF4132 domain-containing protein n=1 Tax=Glycomyces terrestris TaxID=2493553 RepID=A0A426USX0_9ACTN|nr:DUF4132 domain-containing protein [Glycomyces terrestris]RRR96794.1 DUF4132 domain-containing protein [Glycomyces terrestris]